MPSALSIVPQILKNKTGARKLLDGMEAAEKAASVPVPCDTSADVQGRLCGPGRKLADGAGQARQAASCADGETRSSPLSGEAFAPAGGAGVAPLCTAPGFSLGTYGRLVSPAEKAGPLSSSDRSAFSIVERFRLQSAARRLLPMEGVAGCLRRRQGGRDMVDLWHMPEVNRAKFGGLQTCSSVAMCPVCAAKISERRRIEVAAAIEAWEALGGEVVMLTLTVRHNASDKYDWLLDGLKGALKRVYQGKQGQKFKGWGLRGTIGSTETTWGEGSGYHPHIHQLLFVDADCPFDLLLIQYRKQWDSALRLAGMRGVTTAGVDMSFNKDHRAEYVNKIGGWDLEHELTKGPVKKGREGRYSPMQLLASFADFALTGDVDHPGRQHGRIWQSYALAMKGRHHLQWSRGLRKMLGLAAAKTDEEIAEEKDKLGILLARLDRKEWATVLHFDARAELLNVAAGGSLQVVRDFLTNLDWRLTNAEEKRLGLLSNAVDIIDAVDNFGLPIPISEEGEHRLELSQRSRTLSDERKQQQLCDEERSASDLLARLDQQEAAADELGLTLSEYLEMQKRLSEFSGGRLLQVVSRSVQCQSKAEQYAACD